MSAVANTLEPQGRASAGPRAGLFISLGLAGLAAVAFAPALRNDFVNFDDNLYVSENRQVLAGMTADSVAWAWTTLHAGYWQPLTWMSLQLDTQLLGRSAWGFHLTNQCWHVVNVVLLFWTLRRLTGSTWRSAAVAALFGVHPLRVESVAWISERKDVLSTFFGLLTLVAYQAYAERPRLWRYAVVMVALALGLMAKPMLVTLPVVLLLLDFWPLGRAPFGVRAVGGPAAAPASWTWLVVEKLPLFALAVAVGVVTIIAQEQAHALLSLERLSLPVRLGTAVMAYGWYLAKTVWPAGLAPTYPHPGPELSWPAVGGIALALAAITALALTSARKRPYFLVGWFWFLVTLAPVVGLLQAGEQPWADRFTYVPHIGLLLMLVWGAYDVMQFAQVSRELRHLVTAVLVVACVGASIVQTIRWHDSVTIMTHALRVAEANPVAHNTLGVALLQQGHADQASRHFREALRLDPGSVKATFNLGLALAQQGDSDAAAAQYRETIRLDPAFAPAHYNLGVTLAQQGSIAAAMAAFEEALRLEPAMAPAHYNLAVALVEIGKADEAMAHFAEAMRLNPDFERMRLPAGIMLAAHGRPADAVTHLRAAPRVDAEAEGLIEYHLGRVYAALGRWTEATEAFRRATTLRPNAAHYRAGLAWALHNQGQEPAAADAYRHALALDTQWPHLAARQAWALATHPDGRQRDGPWALMLAEQASQGTEKPDPRILDTLAAAQAEAGQFDKAVVTIGAARKLAVAASQTTLARAMDERRQQYAKRQPFRAAP
jgi:Flp pilus assembly protein TadD